MSLADFPPPRPVQDFEPSRDLTLRLALLEPQHPTSAHPLPATLQPSCYSRLHHLQNVLCRYSPWLQLVVATGGCSRWLQPLVAGAGCTRWLQVLVAGAGCSRWLQPVAAAGGCSWWLQPVVAAGGCRLQLAVAGAGCRRWLQPVVSSRSESEALHDDCRLEGGDGWCTAGLPGCSRRLQPLVAAGGCSCWLADPNGWQFAQKPNSGLGGFLIKHRLRFSSGLSIPSEKESAPSTSSSSSPPS